MKVTRSFSVVVIATYGVALGACGGGGDSPSAGVPTGTTPPPTATNTSPTVSGAPAEMTVAQDTSSDPVGFTVRDAETDATNLSVSTTSSNPGLLPAGSIQLAGSGSARTLLLDPTHGEAGSAIVTVTVTDAAGLSSSTSVAVTVDSQTRSFREMVDTAFAKDADAEGEAVTGYNWVDNPEDDVTAFDHLLAP